MRPRNFTTWAWISSISALVESCDAPIPMPTPNSANPLALKTMRAYFPDIPLVPTGGVSAETAGEWVRAGAVAVGMGSWLIGDGEPSGVTRRSREVVAAVSVPTS